MYKKRPENFGASFTEDNPDTSKEVPKSDREKFEAAIWLESEAMGLFSQNAEEIDKLVKRFLALDAEETVSKSGEVTELDRCIRKLSDINLEQVQNLEKQYAKSVHLFPDESQPLKEAIENAKKSTSKEQTVDDKISTLNSLADDEIKKFTV